jgi:hypothetical protein
MIDDRTHEWSRVKDHDTVRLRRFAASRLRRIVRFSMYIVRVRARGNASIECRRPAGIHAPHPSGTVQTPKLFDTEKVPKFANVN